MRSSSWQVTVGVSLVGASAVVYAIQTAIFRRGGETLFYLFQDLAFLPLQVLLVTLVLNAFLMRREKGVLLRKLNMVIGVFFLELGTPLLVALSRFDRRLDAVRPFVLVDIDWTQRHFAAATKGVLSHQSALDCDRGDLAALRALLSERHGFLIGLLGNPSLLEHDSFSELLWAICHLSEEIERQRDVGTLDAEDARHIAGDIRRAYALLLAEWLSYANHLRQDYPYMYSLVVRTNPFVETVRPDDGRRIPLTYGPSK